MNNPQKNNFEKLKELDMKEFADKLSPSMFATCMSKKCVVFPYCEKYPAKADCKDVFMDWLKDTSNIDKVPPKNSVWKSTGWITILLWIVIT